MISTFLKKSLEKIMNGELNIIFSENMHEREVEDQDFQGLSPEQTPGGIGEEPAPTGEWVERILNEMSWDEKIKYITGYTSLAIHPIPRLGIPSVWGSDATSGLRCFKGGTAFPAAIAMAATWNPELIEKVGETLGEEARARGISILLGPGINIYRVPTNGRNFEYMGEDPHLTGKTAAAYIRGLQDRGVITTVKHFACNNSEYDRHKCDSVVDDRTLHEIYLPAFRTAIKEGGSRAVMSAYNPVNGVYASENRHLLTEILRNEWGFDGFVISDWDSLYSTSGPVKNGLDIEMPGAKWLTPEKIAAEISKGTIEKSDIDKMVGRLLSTFHSFGIFNRSQIDRSAAPSGDEHDLTALQTAREGIVLLKNDPPEGLKTPLLPLNTNKIKSIVITGRTALMTPTGGGGSSHVKISQKNDIVRGILARLEDENKGIRVQYVPYKKAYLSGKNKKIIQNADVVVICAGFKSFEETECFERSWYLPENQGKLINNVTALNSRTAVILTVGGGVETESWIRGTAALMHSFYLGQSTGTAVADILFGKINPSGKLPFSMARKWSDFASTSYYVDKPEAISAGRIFVGQGNPEKRKIWPMEYGEKLAVGYRHFDTAKIEPQFAFGHGLSYSDFGLTELKVSKPLLKDKDKRRVSIILTNTGDNEGAQVVQLYIRDEESSLPRPDKELKAFKKVFLPPGASEKLSFLLNPEDFSFYNDEKKEWICESGDFTLLAGFSSRDIRCTAKFKV